MREIAPKIIIDPKIRFGKPVIKGTRITVDEVLGFLCNGMDYQEIEIEYGIKKKDILAVIQYVSSFVNQTEIKLLKHMEAIKV